MNVYYELSDYAIEELGLYGSKYLVRNNLTGTVSHVVARPYNLMIMQMSDRAWAEDTDCVKFIKNRMKDISTEYLSLLTEPEIKEFRWIKLKSVTV